MNYAILFISAFLNNKTTDLWIIASAIPATVKTPPKIAQILIKNLKMFLYIVYIQQLLEKDHI